MINKSSHSGISSIENSHPSNKALPSYFDVEQISRSSRVDEKKGKEMWDLMFKAIHDHNKAQVEKEFPVREWPF